MLGKVGEEKGEQRGIVASEGGSGARSGLAALPGWVLAAGSERRWQRLHGGKGVTPAPGDVSDILFIRQGPFSIPLFPEKKKKEKKKPQPLLGSLKANVPA